MMRIMNLPRLELEPFAGDPLKYTSIMTAFKDVVEMATADKGTCLIRLLSLTTGNGEGSHT